MDSIIKVSLAIILGTAALFILLAIVGFAITLAA